VQILPGWEMSGNSREPLEVSEHHGFEESDGVTLVVELAEGPPLGVSVVVVNFRDAAGVDRIRRHLIAVVESRPRAAPPLCVGDIFLAYDVSLSVHDGYLRVEAFGKRTKEDSEKLALSFAKFSAEHQLHNILLVLNLEGRLDTFEIHDLVSRFRDCGLGASHRIAFIDKHEESKPDQRFMEDVVRTRGLDAAAFETEDDALSWLLRS